jgi:hypothetical protein
VTNACIFQLYGFHEVMQRNVGVAATQPRQQRGHKAGKSHKRISAKRTKQQIEPDHVRLHMVQRFQHVEEIAGIVECPAAHDPESVGLGMVLLQLVSQNREVQEWIALQFLRKVKPVLTQSPGTRGKSCDQTNLHSSPVLRAPVASMCFQEKMLAARDRKEKNSRARYFRLGRIGSGVRWQVSRAKIRLQTFLRN